MADEGKTEVITAGKPGSLIDKIADNWSKAAEHSEVLEAEPTAEKETTEEPEKETEVVEGEEKVESESEDTKEKEEPKEEPKRDKVQERIDELVAQKKTAQEQVAELQAKLEAFEKAPQKEYVPTPTVENPLADVMSLEDLNERESTAEKIRANCLRNRDGFTVTDKDGKEIFYDANAVREALVWTDKLLRKDVPNRQKWLATHSQHNEASKQLFPWLFDARTSEYQYAQSIERNFPEIKKFPEYKHLIGMMIYAEKKLAEEKAATNKVIAKVTGKEKLPSIPAASSTSSTTTKQAPKTASKLPVRPTKSDTLNYIMDNVLKDFKTNY